MRFLGRKVLFGRKKQRIQIGISQNDRYICLVCQDESGFHSTWYEKIGKAERKKYDLDTLVNKIRPQAVRFTEKIAIVHCIPYEYIWRKTLFFPVNQSNETYYRQIIQYLKQEVPLNIEDLYFDYYMEKLEENNVIKVIVYVLRKGFADSLKNTIGEIVLDCEAYCFIRGIHYLLRKNIEFDFNSNTEERYYKFGGKIIQINHNGVKLSNCTSIRKGELISIEKYAFEKDILDPHLYTLALGACLWNGKG